MQKYNYKTKEYEEYSVPKEWHCPIYSNNMKENINCCQCGEVVEIGQCFTSLEVHNWVGLGYSVCPVCYDKEWERRRKYES